MQQTQNKESSPSASGSKQSVLDQDENYQASRNQRSRQSVDEAKQLLDEIAFGAGIHSGQTHSTHRPIDLARLVKGILLSPFYLIIFIFKLILKPFKRADFALVKEMGKFLAHPGHFFWFNRLAPQTASRHFRTSSTDAMTHHARRYGAHLAMLALALIVVIFSGFSGLTRPILSPESMAPIDGSSQYGTMLQTGNMHEIYITAITSGTAEPRRTKVYEVAQGETLRGLADRFGISLNSLLYANLIVDPDATLKQGQKLVVPPTTSMLHIANQGDTIGKLADLYQVDPLTIINYPINNLAGSDLKTQLLPGQEVIVPNGVMPLRDKLFIYTIKPGDTIKSVAEKFGISTYTVMVANDLDSSDSLLPDGELDILPISGIQYTIRAGDTLQGIASRYSVPVESIINYAPNGVARNMKLEANRTIILPNGIIPPPPPPTPAPIAAAPQKPATTTNNNSRPAPTAKSSNSKPAASSSSKPAAAAAKPATSSTTKRAPITSSGGGGVATGSMIWPMGGIITTYFGQRIWYGIHMGLDISTGCGAPVVAADGGTVIEAGWSPYGYGITAQVDHGRGIVTRYGHFSRILVSSGQRVSRGQVLGLEGTTGNSTGCHLHFEVKVNGSYTDPLRWIR